MSLPERADASRARDEYRALRATIRARGTTRVWVFVVGAGLWAALMVAVLVIEPGAGTALIPLFVLAATFEGVFGLHTGVERIGRYLQVCHRDRWERTAMAFGPPAAGTGADPLFTTLFVAAVLINFLQAVSLTDASVDVGVLGLMHGLLVVRILVAKRAAARQRPADLRRFEDLDLRAD